MKQRGALFVLLFALCMALSCAAWAENREPIRLIDIDPTSFWKDNGIRKTNVSYDPWGDSVALLRGENAADLMVLRSYNDDFAVFRDSGLLADLSASEAIREAVDRMTPAIRQLITADDGRILALPYRAGLHPFYWSQEAWDAAGLTEADVPQSYEELLDFIERWIERIQDEPKKDVCVSRLTTWNTGTEKYNYCWWLMETLLTSWELQQRHAGEAVHFGTAEFAALAERTRELALALYEAEPRQKKRAAMLELFQNDLRGGKYANGGSEYGISHTVPLRVTADQPLVMSAYMEMYVVREGSDWRDEAIAFLEQQLSEDDWRFIHCLYEDFDPDDYADCWVTRGWLADYRAYEGEMLFTPVVFHGVRGAETGKESAMMQFFEGKITAREMADRLDELIGYAPKNEG